MRVGRRANGRGVFVDDPLDPVAGGVGPHRRSGDRTAICVDYRPLDEWDRLRDAVPGPRERRDARALQDLTTRNHHHAGEQACLDWKGRFQSSRTSYDSLA
ncbi:hypothetical protein D3C86_1288620 [compost metagenome]